MTMKPIFIQYLNVNCMLQTQIFLSNISHPVFSFKDKNTALLKRLKQVIIAIKELYTVFINHQSYLN